MTMAPCTVQTVILFLALLITCTAMNTRTAAMLDPFTMPSHHDTQQADDHQSEDTSEQSFPAPWPFLLLNSHLSDKNIGPSNTAHHEQVSIHKTAESVSGHHHPLSVSHEISEEEERGLLNGEALGGGKLASQYHNINDDEDINLGKGDALINSVYKLYSLVIFVTNVDEDQRNGLVPNRESTQDSDENKVGQFHYFYNHKDTHLGRVVDNSAYAQGHDEFTTARKEGKSKYTEWNVYVIVAGSVVGVVAVITLTGVWTTRLCRRPRKASRSNIHTAIQTTGSPTILL